MQGSGGYLGAVRLGKGCGRVGDRPLWPPADTLSLLAPTQLTVP